jgi:two-component system, OmpR family, KDP operon response regulator KdpE
MTYTEYKLLCVLVNNSGRIVTYDFILSRVWGDDETSEREYIHVYINRLRKKIETPAQRRFIYNEPKVGYRFQADE